MSLALPSSGTAVLRNGHELNTNLSQHAKVTLDKDARYPASAQPPPTRKNSMSYPYQQKPTIAVCGATGLQGGSVVRFLIQDGTFHVRALTRDVTSPAALQLAATGAEVVRCDYNDVPSIHSAFSGCYGVFAVTTSWESGPDAERQQGYNLVYCAKAESVRHFIWSTLERAAFPVPHRDSKDDIDSYLRSSGVPFTSLVATMTFESMADSTILKPMRAGLVGEWTIPTDSGIPCFCAADTGGFVLAILKNPQQWLGQTLTMITDFVSPRQYFQLLGDASRKVIRASELSLEQFNRIPNMPQPPVPKEFWLNIKHLINNPTWPTAQIATCRALFPNAISLRAWISNNQAALLYAATNPSS